MFLNYLAISVSVLSREVFIGHGYSDGDQETEARLHSASERPCTVHRGCPAPIEPIRMVSLPQNSSKDLVVHNKYTHTPSQALLGTWP